MKSGLVPAVLAAAIVGLASQDASAEAVQLKFANPTPPQSIFNTQGLSPWVDETNKAAEGVFEIKTFAGPGLANLANAYDRTVNGVADIAWGIFGPISTQFPKSGVNLLPFEAKNGLEVALGLWRLHENGVVADEFAKVKLLAIVPFAGVYLHVRKPIHTLADMHGLKITTDGRISGRTIERLGATAVPLAQSDHYQALSRGTIDGAATPWSGVWSFKLFEVTNFHLEADLTNNHGFIAMNKDVYARLPAAGQQILDRHVGEVLVRRLTKVTEESNAFARTRVGGEPGQTIARLTPEEEARWRQAVAPVIEEWIKETPEGEKVLAAFREEVKKIRAGR